jgi:hypothetical protein
MQPGAVFKVAHGAATSHVFSSALTAHLVGAAGSISEYPLPHRHKYTTHAKRKSESAGVFLQRMALFSNLKACHLFSQKWEKPQN